MSRCFVLLSAIVVGTLCVPQAQAQPPQGRQGMRGARSMMPASPARLLMHAAVREEINVTDEQMEKIRELRDSVQRPERPPQRDRQSFRDMTDEERQQAREQMQQRREEMQSRMQDMQEKLADILKPKQMKRLQQINLQMMGPGLLRHERVASALKITDEQREKMREAMQDLRPRRGGDQDTPRPQPSEMREKMKSIMEDILTDEQKETLKGMVGEPFDVSQLQQGRGGPQRGQRGPGRPGGGQRGQR